MVRIGPIHPRTPRQRCTRPRTRNAIIRIETKTTPIIRMWIDCSNGMIQSIDWIVTLRRVVCEPLGESEHQATRSLGRCRQSSFAENLASFDGIAVLAGRGRRLLGALEHGRALAATGRLTAAQRMQSHAEDRPRRERAHRDAVPGRLCRACHFDGPDDRLAVRVRARRSCALRSSAQRKSVDDSRPDSRV